MSRARQRLALAVVVIGSALIAERVYSLASADTELAASASPQRPGAAAPTRAVEAAPPVSPASLVIPELRTDRLAARQLALASPSQQQPSGADTPFGSVRWQPAAPAPPPPAPPPKPVAPPFAYAYMGGLTEDGIRSAFFTRGERVIVVKEGDTIDASYRVDQMSSTHMTLTYLPLGETLQISLGAGR